MILPRRESDSAPDTSCHGIMSSGSSLGSKNWAERFLPESGQSTSQRRSGRFGIEGDAVDSSKHGKTSTGKTSTDITVTTTATSTSTLDVKSTSVSGSSTFGRVTSNSSKSHTDAIIGIVFGALATFGIIVLIGVYYLRKSKKNRLSTAIRLPGRPSADSPQLPLTQKESSMGGEVEAYILKHDSEPLANIVVSEPAEVDSSVDPATVAASTRRMDELMERMQKLERGLAPEMFYRDRGNLTPSEPPGYSSEQGHGERHDSENIVVSEPVEVESIDPTRVDESMERTQQG